jgi:TolB-like protein
VPFRECGFGSFRETEVVFAFGDHRLDPQRRELWRGSERVGVEPQVFDVLAYLVQHRDRVVSREDLLRAIWGGRIVSYSALASRINAVRRALGDDGTRQRLVRTFARKGVRFVGEVKQLAEAPASDVGPRPALPLPQKPSIAVLPFQNLSGEPEQEYFADGIVEEITTAIARFPWLFVIARNSSFTYKGRAVDVRQVARELGVRYVLEGSVRKTGNRVRITARLIDTGSIGPSLGQSLRRHA